MPVLAPGFRAAAPIATIMADYRRLPLGARDGHGASPNGSGMLRLPRRKDDTETAACSTVGTISAWIAKAAC